MSGTINCPVTLGGAEPLRKCSVQDLERLCKAACAGIDSPVRDHSTVTVNQSGPESGPVVKVFVRLTIWSFPPLHVSLCALSPQFTLKGVGGVH